MNIKEAAKQIKNTMLVYLKKDKNGDYVIPIEKQRPIFLLGAPGIGKTAVMEQIATELGIGLVSYSMTHHTRQSAIGLPYIAKKNYNGIECEVSEYTMSEIIASVYNYIENSGKSEGILFLDEINCISETLAPAMLRFLQFKTFGTHPVPAGWVVVTAGNPPEYNKSVKEYDVATLDRVKMIRVEPCYDVWREYAVNMRVHPSVIAYLDIKKSDFYLIENTPVGKSFVTARGWEDLSRIIASFETENIEVDISLIEQYIQNSRVASDYFDFYKSFNRFNSICNPENIGNGIYDEAVIEQVKNASDSEKLGFVNALCDDVSASLSNAVFIRNAIKLELAAIKMATEKDGGFEKCAENIFDALAGSEESSGFTYVCEPKVDRKLRLYANNELNELAKSLKHSDDVKIALNDFYDNKKAELLMTVNKADARLTNSLNFISDAFNNSVYLSVFISGIVCNKESSAFLRDFGNKLFSKLTNTQNRIEPDEVLRELAVV